MDAASRTTCSRSSCPASSCTRRRRSRAESAAVLNVAPDHLDWYDGSAWTATPRDKGRIYDGAQRACVYNVADPATEQLVREADVVEGARAIGFTLGIPPVGMVGVVEDVLVDRAFVDERQRSAAELCAIADLAPPAPALRRQRARRRGPGPGPRRHAGRRPRRPAGVPSRRAPHRRGRRPSPASTYVDDSKATNPHAAQASLAAYDDVVWIAGGLAKGATSTSWSTRWRGRLRGVVLIGRDRAVIAEALARHAPDVPVIDVTAGETGTDGPDGPRRRAPRPRLARAGRHRAAGAGRAPRWTCSPTTARGATRSPQRSAGSRRLADRPAGGRRAITAARPDRAHASTAVAPPERSRHDWVRPSGDAMDRPLTSYYLLLGSTALLLTSAW